MVYRILVSCGVWTYPSRVLSTAIPPIPFALPSAGARVPGDSERVRREAGNSPAGDTAYAPEPARLHRPSQHGLRDHQPDIRFTPHAGAGGPMYGPLRCQPHVLPARLQLPPVHHRYGSSRRTGVDACWSVSSLMLVVIAVRCFGARTSGNAEQAPFKLRTRYRRQLPSGYRGCTMHLMTKIRAWR